MRFQAERSSIGNVKYLQSDHGSAAHFKTAAANLVKRARGKRIALGVQRSNVHGSTASSDGLRSVELNLQGTHAGDQKLLFIASSQDVAGVCSKGNFSRANRKIGRRSRMNASRNEDR